MGSQMCLEKENGQAHIKFVILKTVLPKNGGFVLQYRNLCFYIIHRLHNFLLKRSYQNQKIFLIGQLMIVNKSFV
jgi:hypothetical protein